MKFTIKTSLCLLLGLQMGCATTYTIEPNELKRLADTCNLQESYGFDYHHMGDTEATTYLVYAVPCFEFDPFPRIQKYGEIEE